MALIKILDENISSRIAAGEIVERPASIVKELVENSIDAGATAISITIEDGGIESIRVSDNGSGILTEDMPLSVVKHATSKIYKLSDLYSVYTMGFRGEALSSIASVSMLTIKSKAKTEDVGSILTASGSKNIKIVPAGLPDGTTIQVDKIFFNTPARLKFLKKSSAEAAKITNVVESMILAHPEISFKYTSNGKLIYHSPGDNDLINAISCVEGNDLRQSLIKVNYDLYGISLYGYICDPQISYKKNSGYIFVNKRHIKSDLIYSAILRSYGERLLKGTTPYYVLNIKMDAKDVDVNVHPNKLHVHFRDDSKIVYLISNSITEALEKHIKTPVIDIPKVSDDKKSNLTNIITSSLDYDKSINNHLTDSKEISKYVREIIDRVDKPNLNGTLTFAQTPLVKKESFSREILQTNEKYEQPVIINQIPDYTIIGSVFEGYIIVEANETIYFIDQHAAHERLIYDSLRNDMNKDVPIQHLLVSDVVKLSHEEYNAIISNVEILEKAGFSIEEFGVMTVKVNAVPVYVKDINISVLIHDIAEELIHGNNVFQNNIISEKIAKAACKRAVKGTWKLPHDAVDLLVKELLSSDTIPCCPHGRPVAIAITKSQLEKNFKRRV